MNVQEPIEAVLARANGMSTVPLTLGDAARLAREVERRHTQAEWDDAEAVYLRKVVALTADNAALLARIERLRAVARRVGWAQRQDCLQPGDLGEAVE